MLAFRTYPKAENRSPASQEQEDGDKSPKEKKSQLQPPSSPNPPQTRRKSITKKALLLRMPGKIRMSAIVRASNGWVGHSETGSD